MNKFYKHLAVVMTAAVMLPSAQPVKAQNMALDINFGEKLTLQETNGYPALSGNTLERFNQAVAELPDEVPVISPFEVSGENVFYVSPDGSDLNNGLSEQTALASVSKALDKVQMLTDSEKANGTVIYVKGGEYTVRESMEITENHSSANAPLFITAYDGEAVFSVSGSFSEADMTLVTQDNTNFSDYMRVAPEAKDNLYYIDYSDLGVTGISHDENIMFGNKPLNIARYPNAGYDAISEVIVGGYGKNCTWVPMDKRAFSWVDTGNIRVYGKFVYEWSFEDSSISLDKSGEQIQATKSLSYYDAPIAKYLKGGGASMYYYYNIFEELDTPGEWFADNTNQRLYIYPLEGSGNYYLSNNNINIFNVSDAQNIVFDGITINGADKGIEVINSKNTVIQECKISNTVSEAVYMYDTEKCGIISSVILGAGNAQNTVSVRESAEKRKELTPSRNFIQNNIICNGNRAIVLTSTGSIVSHNLIQNTNNGAIVFHGAENIIEYNEISGAQQKVSDSGAIYTGVNFTIRNNHIRYNYIHDARHDSMVARGIYIDDCNDNEYVYGNIIKNYQYGIFLHNGDGHVVKDNVVADVREPIGNTYDYAINSINNTQMQDLYFVKGNVLSDYEADKYGESLTWQTRYNTSLTDEYNAIKSAQNVFASFGDENTAVSKIKDVVNKKLKYPYIPYNLISGYNEVKACVDVVVDHDCYYLNNTVLNCTYSPVYATTVGINNVEENNKEITADTQDYINGISYFANTGLLNKTEILLDKPVIYLKDGGVIHNFNGFAWSKVDNANYYNIKIATDSSFNNVVIDADTSAPEYSLYKYTCAGTDSEVEKNRTYNYKDAVTGETDFVKDKTYYVKVTAVNLSNSINAGTVSSDVCSFVISDEEEQSASYGIIMGDVSNYLLIEGSVPYYTPNNKVNLLIYDGAYQKSELMANPEAVKQIVQIELDNKNKFSYRFKINDDDVSNLNVSVKIANKELHEDSFAAMVQTLTEVTLDASSELIDGKTIAKAAATVNNRFNAIEKYSVVIAEYDEDKTLIGCRYAEFVTADNNEGNIEYNVQQEASLVKAYVWQDMKPLTNDQTIE